MQTLNQELAATNQELREANEELGTTNHQLLRTNRDLDNFIHAASHDLKAPIANIKGLPLALRQDLPAAAVSTPLIGHLLGLVVVMLTTTMDSNDLARINELHIDGLVSKPLTEEKTNHILQLRFQRSLPAQ